MSERHPPDLLPTKEPDDAEVEPLQFVVRANAQGEQTLDLVEGSFDEQSYGVGGVHTAQLFAELCRSRGLLPRVCGHHELVQTPNRELIESEPAWNATGTAAILSRPQPSTLDPVRDCIHRHAQLWCHSASFDAPVNDSAADREPGSELRHSQTIELLQHVRNT